MPVRHRRLRFGVSEALVLGALTAGVALVLGPRPEASAQVDREEVALAAVIETAHAEHEFVARKKKDANADSVPEYGTLAELEGAGLFSRRVETDAAGAFSIVAGYRVEVLLPTGVNGARQVILASSTGKPDPGYAGQFFAVVATPIPGLSSGKRSFYVDAGGRRYEAEGVTDAAGNPYGPPPARVLTDAEVDRDAEGPVWRLRDGPPPIGNH